MAKKPAKKPAKKIAEKPAKKAVKKPARANRKPAKKVEKYSAAGMSQAGVMVVINAAEYKRMGLPGYPWSKKLKSDMQKAVNGAKTLGDVNRIIDELAAKNGPKAAA